MARDKGNSLLGVDEISLKKGHQDYVTLVTSRTKYELKILVVFEELTNLGADRLSKAKNLFSELKNLNELNFSKFIKTLENHERQKYQSLHDQFYDVSKKLTIALEQKLSEVQNSNTRAITPIIELKKSESFTKGVAQLGKIYTEICSLQKLPLEMPKFCDSMASHLSYLKKQNPIKDLEYSKPIGEDEKSIHAQVKITSEKFARTTLLLLSFDASQLADSKKEAVSEARLKARWHMILLVALFSDLKLRSESQFHKTRNGYAHLFDKKSIEDEIREYQRYCEETLSPFLDEGMKKQILIVIKRKIEEGASQPLAKEEKHTAQSNETQSEIQTQTQTGLKN